jgi:hypothetical protein
VQKFFDTLRASKESLHEHTTVSVLAFVTRLTAIKSKFALSNNCYKELLNLISDVLPNNHKRPKDMYPSKKCCLLSIWVDYSFDRTSRQRLVNQVLGNPVRFHHPSVVTLPRNGRRVLATTWHHYRFAPDGDYRTAQGVVSHDF